MTLRFQRVIDILNYARQFHSDLEAYYHRLECVVDTQKMRLLLDYMARHQHHLAEAVEHFSHDAPKTVLEAWFDNAPELDSLPCYEKNVHLSGDPDLEEVVDMALKLDDCLIELYRQLANTTATPEVKEVFQNLLKMEEIDKAQLVRNALLLTDYAGDTE